MLVSSIAKLNAAKNSPSYKRDNAFNGDKNIIAADRCKPRYDIKSSATTNRNAECISLNNENHSLMLLA